MHISQLANAIELLAPAPVTTDEEVLEHFASKYPLIDYHGRKVFLFTDARDFGSNKHSVTIHSRNHPVTPEHIYQYVLITYCYEGRFSMTVDGAKIVLEKGDCLVTDRLVPHGVDRTGPSDMAVDIVLNDRFFERRFLTDATRLGSKFAHELVMTNSTHTSWRLYRSSNDEFARALVERILCEQLDVHVGSHDIIDDLAAALLTHLIRSYEPDIADSDAARRDSELVGIVREYISQHYQDGNLSRMAKALGYDSSYLSAFIRRATGTTFKQAVNAERMRHAELLLQTTSMTVADIAREVGVSNITMFYRRFHDFVGCTPQEYRNLR